MRTAKTMRILLGAAGVAVMGYGLQGFLTAPEITARPEVGEWLIAAIILHDALLAPAVFVLSAAAYRTTGVRLRGRLAALLLIGGSLVLISYPALSQKGNNPNHTVLPLDYARNLSAVLAALAAIVVLLSVTDLLRSRRRRKLLRAVREPEPIETEAPQPELSEPEAAEPERIEPEARQPEPDEPEASPSEPEPEEPEPEEPEPNEPHLEEAEQIPRDA